MSISKRMIAPLSWACAIGIAMIQGCGGTATEAGTAPGAPAAVENPAPAQGPANRPTEPNPAEDADALQIG